jgi:hypothetical protein
MLSLRINYISLAKNGKSDFHALMKVLGYYGLLAATQIAISFSKTSSEIKNHLQE